MPEIRVVIDNSGSVSDELLARAVREIDRMTHERNVLMWLAKGLSKLTRRLRRRG